MYYIYGSNDDLKEADTKNRTCYYFNDIIKIEGFNLDNTLIENHVKIL